MSISTHRARWIVSSMVFAFIAASVGCNRQDTECLSGIGKKSAEIAQRSPHLVLKVVEGAVQGAPEIVERVKLDAKLLSERHQASRAASRAKKRAAAELSHAAE